MNSGAMDAIQMKSSGLEVAAICKAFGTAQGSLPVIDNIGFSQAQGEVVCIVGASGSGKTTLLRILAGLEKPDSGTLRLAGHDIQGPGPERAMIFQQFGLMPWLTVMENVMFGLAPGDLPEEEKQARAKDAIERVRLNGFEHFHPKALSGGMQQRVGIARALAVRPALLLCDEPFAAVDAITRQLMQTDLLNIVTQQKATVLLVTHDIEEALFLGDRVLVFSSRPARLLRDVPVEIDKPRSHEVRVTPEFQRLRGMIWNILQANQ
ncbi:MAG: ABC transporter ATP-binding protein [Burkholderiales bacterium]